MNSEKPSGNSYRGIVLVSAIGTEFAFCILGGLYLGKWLDTKLSTAPWLLVAGLFVGLAAGIAGILSLVKAFTPKEDKQD